MAVEASECFGDGFDDGFDDGGFVEDVVVNEDMEVVVEDRLGDIPLSISF